MTTLAVAIENKEWELAALYLLLGVAQAAAQLPPEAVHGLVEILDAEARPREARPDRRR